MGRLNLPAFTIGWMAGPFPLINTLECVLAPSTAGRVVPVSPRKQPEHWTTTQVAAYLGFTGSRSSQAASARRQMRLWKIAPVARTVGKGGENLYPADQVRQRRPKPDQETPT